jgi:hypothetical protein
MPDAPVATIAADKLSQLTGFSLIELAGLARKGYFPKANDGLYEQTRSIQGCFLAYKDRLQAAGTLPQYESMGQCSAATGIPHSVLKAAKKKSGAFKAHRIFLEPLLKWIFSKESDGTDWGERFKRAQALIEEHKLAERDHKILNKDDATFAASKIMALLFASLDRRSDQMPAILQGMNAPQIKEKLAQADGLLKAALRTEFGALLKSKKQ